MKKTLIAASIAALAAGSVQAVELYSSDTTTFSTYGKLQLELQNFDGENRIQNQGSRFGFAGTQQLNGGLEGFANFELRFNPGFENESTPTVRNSYVGVRGTFGEVKAGNFDSIVYTFVDSNADIMENLGYRSLDDGSNNARGFTVAYQTADLNGLTLAVAAKHYSSEDANDIDWDNGTKGTPYPSQGVKGDEAWNVQIAGSYAITDSLTFAFGFDQNNKKGQPVLENEDGTFDPVISLGLVYSQDALTAGLLAQQAGDYTAYGVVGSYSYGAGSVYGIVTLLDNDEDSGVDFAIGTNYNLASNFYVYAEVAVGNDDVSSIQTAKFDAAGDIDSIEGTTAITLGASYSW